MSASIYGWAAKHTRTDRRYNLGPGDAAEVTFELVVVNDLPERVTLSGIDWVPTLDEHPEKVVRLQEVTRWLRELDNFEATMIAGLLEVRFA